MFATLSKQNAETCGIAAGVITSTAGLNHSSFVFYHLTSCVNFQTKWVTFIGSFGKPGL